MPLVTVLWKSTPEKEQQYDGNFKNESFKRNRLWRCREQRIWREGQLQSEEWGTGCKLLTQGSLPQVCPDDWASCITAASFYLLILVYVDYKFFTTKYITCCAGSCPLVLQSPLERQTLIIIPTSKSSKQQTRTALFLNPKNALTCFLQQKPEHVACSVLPRQAACSPPYMAFSLFIIYFGVVSCHTHLYLIEAKIAPLITTQSAPCSNSNAPRNVRHIFKLS